MTTTVHGTLFIGAIGSDGIVLVVDSRGCIVDANGNAIGYVDGVPKAHLLNERFPILCAGKSTIMGEFVHSLISRFNTQEHRWLDIQASFENFRTFVSSIDANFDQQFLGAGYYQGTPYLFNFSRSERAANANGFIFNEPDLSPYLQPHSSELKMCAELIEILPPIIYQYASDYNKQTDIGGPIAVIEVRNGNTVVWHQNNFLNNAPQNYRAFVELIRTNHLVLTPVNGASRESVIRAMEANPNYR